MIVSVAGVKGGSGKTIVSTSLALSVSGCRFLDCDVEEPNAHLYLKPAYRKRERVAITVPKPKNWRGADLRAAVEFCQYNALAIMRGRLEVFKELCTGCGGCFLLAEKGVLAKEDYTVGSIKTGDGRGGIEVVTGELRVGSQRTGRLVAAMMKKVQKGRDTIIDCPPGSARPMLETARGSDYCLLVTEATPFGLQDLKAGVEALRLIGVKFGVVTNKLWSDESGIVDFCKAKNISIMLEIPFARDIAEASSMGKALPDISPHWAGEFSHLWERLKNSI